MKPASSVAASPLFQARLDAAQGHLLIAALAERPFKLVYELIGKLNGLANAARLRDADDCFTYAFDATEVKLVLAALGDLPYHQVHELMDSLQGQWRAQQAKPATKRTKRIKR